MPRAHIAVPEAPPDEDRRSLRLCFFLAALVHGALLLLPTPWAGAAAAPEPPRLIHRFVLSPPPPPVREHNHVQVERRPDAVPIPVPEMFLEDSPPDRVPLPTADVEDLAEFPVMLPTGPAPPLPPEPEPEGPIHVLGAVVPPEAVFAPEPQYPPAALRLHRPGTVVLQATIDREGRVSDLEVLRGEPLGMTEAALAAVRHWRFRPATLEGRPVAVYYHLTVHFQSR